jgi:POT family proton-dependent oligopeptide transporter
MSTAGGALITIYGLLTGFLVDNIGVSKSLKLGFALSLLARIGIFITTSSNMLLFHVLVTLPMANCLGIPVLTTGIRRYTDDGNRGFAFGLFYVVMNVAALISGPVVDVLTIRYRRDAHDEHGGQSDATTTITDSTTMERIWSLTSYRAIILTGIIANILSCFVAWTVREIKVDQQQSSPISMDVPPSLSVPKSPRGIATFRPVKGSPMKILRQTFNAPSFRRFLVVCIITLNVRMIFRHLDATLPKYMIREFGDNVPKGTIYSINPFLIILLVPIVTASTSNIDPLVMIHFGSYISAISVFALAFSTSISACIVFVTVLSIGEAIWSPRLYDYSVSVCKEGREGTYMALSSAPLFLAKLPVGFLSGALLQKYCPETGERNSKAMWLIIGLLTASSPLFMTCFWGYISKKDEDDDLEEEEENVTYTELNTRPTTD